MLYCKALQLSPPYRLTYVLFTCSMEASGTKYTAINELMYNATHGGCTLNVLVSDSRAHDTVGAVAVDRAGNVACATSTGGIRNKMVGRVGDSPIIGMTSFTRISFK